MLQVFDHWADAPCRMQTGFKLDAGPVSVRSAQPRSILARCGASPEGLLSQLETARNALIGLI